MGLPLFVPPVESDLGRKSSKISPTSPPRSSIRRLPFTGRAGHRAHTSRVVAASDNNRRSLPRAVANALLAENVSTEMMSAAEYIRSSSANQDDAAPAGNPRDNRRTTRSLRMDQRFGSDWRNRDWERPQQDLDSTWWVVEHRLWGDRARLTRLGPDNISRLRPHQRTAVQVSSLPRDRAARRTASSRVSPLSVPWSTATTPAPWSPQPTTSRETNDNMDGLGDRMRSVSPESWNTLLTTLTPDPQPPSASSSFASTVASRSAAASSNTSLSEMGRPVESGVEPPCEPGQDNSEGEDEENPLTRVQARNASRASNPVRFNVPDYNIDGPSDVAALEQEIINGRQMLHERHRRMLDSRERYLRRARRIDELSEDLMSRLPNREERNSWVGLLSFASEDDQTGNHSQSNGEGSATSGNNASTADEELSGWQRIVRGLANRDDIPDEWWTEAGLSRNLTRDRS